MRSTRRKALQTIAGATVAAPVVAQHRHEAASDIVQVAAPAKPKFFTTAEMGTTAALVDLIIPRTGTPGASDAGVHRIIDGIVGKAVPLQKRWREGLAWADAEAKREGAESFVQLAQPKQIAILERAEKSESAFFTLLKNSTIDVYYSTREGLVTELGWNANTYLPEFKGCTHPEHQG
jgi:hypothetical protein